MVKITNKFGDEKRGKQDTAVYQMHYGKQVRRVREEKKDANTPKQLQQRARFKRGTDFALKLTKPERDFIKRYIDDAGIRTPAGNPITWYNFAKNIAMTVPKVEMKIEPSRVGFSGVYGAWRYRKAITLTNTISALTNHRFQITLTPANFDYTKSRTDGGDIRFSARDDTIPLPYWIETWVHNGTSRIWVRIDNVPVGTNICFYIYYGNPTATSESNGDNTFRFFDDFNRVDSAHLGPKWTEFGDHLWAISGNTLHRPDATTGAVHTALATTFGTQTDVTIRAKIRITAFSGPDQQLGIIVRSNTSIDAAHRGYALNWREVITNLQLLDSAILWLSSVSKPAHVLGDWWWFELQVIGTTIRGKAWRDGDVEPTTWCLTVTRTTVASGLVGFYTLNSGIAAGNFDVFFVYEPAEITIHSIGPEETAFVVAMLEAFSISHPAIERWELLNAAGGVIKSEDGLSRLTDRIVSSVFRDAVIRDVRRIRVRTLAGLSYDFDVR